MGISIMPLSFNMVFNKPSLTRYSSFIFQIQWNHLEEQLSKNLNIEFKNAVYTMSEYLGYLSFIISERIDEPKLGQRLFIITKAGRIPLFAFELRSLTDGSPTLR